MEYKVFEFSTLVDLDKPFWCSESECPNKNESKGASKSNWQQLVEQYTEFVPRSMYPDEETIMTLLRCLEDITDIGIPSNISCSVLCALHAFLSTALEIPCIRDALDPYTIEDLHSELQGISEAIASRSSALYSPPSPAI